MEFYQAEAGILSLDEVLHRLEKHDKGFEKIFLK
jgi:hypothetical protein